MAKRDTKAAAPPSHADDDALDREVAGLSYEAALAELEAIIEGVEHGELGLEAALGAYRRGRALLKRCRSVLDQAETEIKRLSLLDADEAAGASAREQGA